MITVKEEIYSITGKEIVNKVIDAREVVNLTVNNIVTSEGDMKKEIYDADNDGVVDFAKDLVVSNEEWTQFDLILSTI